MPTAADTPKARRIEGMETWAVILTNLDNTSEAIHPIIIPMNPPRNVSKTASAKNCMFI